MVEGKEDKSTIFWNPYNCYFNLLLFFFLEINKLILHIHEWVHTLTPSSFILPSFYQDKHRTIEGMGNLYLISSNKKWQRVNLFHWKKSYNNQFIWEKTTIINFIIVNGKKFKVLVEAFFYQNFQPSKTKNLH